MRLLLDTHVFLRWRAARDMRPQAIDAIRGADDVFVSAASAWEVAIKVAGGKIRLSGSFGEGVTASGFVPLPINFLHALAAGELPPHHRDPFDRMLVAQARVERLTLITRDRRLESYDARVIWA